MNQNTVNFISTCISRTYIYWKLGKKTAKKCRKLSKREIIKLRKTVLTSVYIHLSSRLMQWNTVNNALIRYGKLILVEWVIYQRNVDIRMMNNFTGSKINTGSAWHFHSNTVFNRCVYYEFLSSRWCTPKKPHCFMTISAEQRPDFGAL